MVGQIVPSNMRPTTKNLLLALTAVLAAISLWAGGATTETSAPTAAGGTAKALQPSADAPRIAYIAARLLEEYHYLQRPLDEELSKRFFDGYIDSLDSRHEHFLQSDVAEFATYRTNLDQLTTGGRGVANLAPAFAIYQRYAERFQQHVSYVNDLLAHEKFKFNTDEKILIDRRHEPFPASVDELRQLWRQRLRYEFLQEKLTREISETNGTFSVKLPADATTNITATLARHYRWSLRMMTNWDSENVLQAYLNALAHAYDPHSDYFSAPHAQDFSIGMNLALFGIGAQLNEDDGYCTIRSLVAGGPAAKSKELKEGDRIVGVAQGDQPVVDVVDMELEKVVQQIRGAKGTEVRLTISPADDRTKRRVVTLVRDEIKLEDSEAKAKLIELPNGKRIGLLELPSFYATVDNLTANSGHSSPKYCSLDVAKLLRKLNKEKVSGIIIDLRSNPGGSLEEAIKFTGLFIKGGPVVLARNPDGQVAVDAAPEGMQVYDGPLAVMINRFSASASEIVAAALQDYGRAVIVGDTSTHGKGTVQNLNPLKPFMLGSTNDPGTIKITIRKFYRVSGASTQLKGVSPDIVLPDVLNYSTQVGEVALDNPLPWDIIQPVNYEKLNLVQPLLQTLKTHSNDRIATNQDFLYVQQDIAQFQKQQAEKTATLNEHDAIKERERVATQNKAREAERTARPTPAGKIYEITVKNADEPGLTEFKPNKEDTNTVSATSNSTSHNIFTRIFEGSTRPHHTFSGTNPATKPADKKAAPPFDPVLDETKNILLDFISLAGKPGPLMVNQ